MSEQPQRSRESGTVQTMFAKTIFVGHAVLCAVLHWGKLDGLLIRHS